MLKRAPLPQATKTRIRRTVRNHDWNSLEEWVKTLDELAELSDAEIEDLARMAANDGEFDPDA
ncbi:MAG: hypothetical protein EA406_11965 [Rhodospirillales bacterium]|nr:MAG: hypothetical protein EA406_11965 [Rhodospirillales bacterium]